MDGSFVDLCSNASRRCATPREKKKMQHGIRLIFEVAKLRFESRVFVGTLKISESQEGNLRESCALGGGMDDRDEV